MLASHDLNYKAYAPISASALLPSWHLHQLAALEMLESCWDACNLLDMCRCFQLTQPLTASSPHSLEKIYVTCDMD